MRKKFRNGGLSPTTARVAVPGTGATAVHRRVGAAWEYYEDMRKYLESGAYSQSTAGSLVPESDAATFNGALWRSVLEHNPDRASALAEYAQRAIKPEYRWSWRNAQLEWDQYKRT